MPLADTKEPNPMRYFVRAAWDAEGAVFYVEETNIPGLATEAANPAELERKLTVLIPELLEANHLALPDSVSVTCHQETQIKVAAAAA
jgi:hypothetical protein